MGTSVPPCSLWQLRRVAVTLSNFPSANLPLMRECEADFNACLASQNGNATGGAVAAVAAAGPSGWVDGRLLTCLKERRNDFSDRCRDKVFSLEKLSHREIAYNAQARDLTL